MRRCVISSIVLFLALVGSAVADTWWINPLDGLWRDDANWSSNAPTRIHGVTTISNAGTKTVTVEPATPETNLVVQRLTLSAPDGSENTLLFTDVSFLLKNTLNVTNGGRLIIRNSDLRLDGITGGEFGVNGQGRVVLESGSIQTLNNALARIGRRGGEASLLIQGGTAGFGDLQVGKFTGSRGLVRLEGGTLHVRNNLDIGDDLNSSGEVLVLGGELIATNTAANTRVGDDGFGRMIISNGLVRVDDISVGRHFGGEFILAGGSLYTGDFSIGRFLNSTGQVLIAGGQLLLPSENLRIGREGIGEMTIQNGSVQASNIVIGFTNNAQGKLTMSGGSLFAGSSLVVGGNANPSQAEFNGGRIRVANLSQSAILNVANGTGTLAGATVWADNVVLTNATGQLIFSSGMLRSRDTVVSNSLPFIVGNGLQPATFHLSGGTHVFADGLIISSNAKLTGCGTIVGNVIVNGTVATNCNITAPAITQPGFSGGTFHLSFQTQPDYEYVAEYKNQLNEPAWTELERRIGTGGVIMIEDPSPALVSRFYRVRVE